MHKKNVFDDPVFSTSTPVYSSRKQKTEKRTNRLLEQSAERLSETDSSLGILSVNSLNISSDYETRAAKYLQRQRDLARSSLNRCDVNFTSIPSRLLKPSELSPSPSGESCVSCDSTVSESDLLPPANCSTPRESILLSTLSNLEQVMQRRQSQGSRLTKLARSMTDSSHDFGKILDEVQKTIDPEITFCPGEEAVEKLKQAELSWKEKNAIPAPLEEFSVGPVSELKMSMGSFFQQRSDRVSAFLAISPEKHQPPVPLIETSSSNDSTMNDVREENDSISISAIAQILSDTKQTPTRALNYFMHGSKKRSYSPTIRKPSCSKNVKEVTEQVAEASTIRISDIYPEKDQNIEHKVEKNVSVVKSPTLELYEKVELDESPGEAVKENVNILNIKGNISPDFIHNKSILSLRSSSSLSSLPNGKLPIATTRTELIWGCVKPSKNASQEFVIKNKSSSRIGLKCSVSHPSFRLIKDGSDVNFSSALKVILHPYESRSVTVTFAPTAVGAAVDYLFFSPISNHNQTVKQFVRLFGYGGHGNISINNVVKDTTGKYLLSLGSIENQEIMRKSFTIKNIGTLPSFAYLGFLSNGLYFFSNVKVAPHVIVLLPEEEKEVVVTYTPKREDMAYLQSKMGCSVIDIGKLTVIHGTEVDRGRLRRLSQKAKEKGLEINAAFESLINTFPREQMPADLKMLKEPLTALDEIIRLMGTKELVITVEQDLDRTVTEQLQETAEFHSLCENTRFESTIYSETCQIEPSKIILTTPRKVSDMIVLKNCSNKQIYFEVTSKPGGLKLRPNHGAAEPGETKFIHLTYTDGGPHFKVNILVENECYEVDVKIIYCVPKAR